MTEPNVITKRCPGCTQQKDTSEFFRSKRTKDGFGSHCKRCRRTYNDSPQGRATKRAYRQRNKERLSAWRKANYRSRKSPEETARYRRNAIQTRYKIRYDEYEALLVAQGGVCAICTKPPAAGKHLHVDHCHSTNRIRGLLCIHCNRALGSLGDDLAGLMRAVRYLERA